MKEKEMMEKGLMPPLVDPIEALESVFSYYRPKNMKTAYLSGPISGCNYAGAVDWRHYAKAELAKLGIEGVSPMRCKEYLKAMDNISATGEEYSHLGVLSTSRGVMTRDRYDTSRCDVCLVNLLGAKQVSIGTCLEIAWADMLRKPIVMAIEKSTAPNIAIGHCYWLAALIDGEGSVYIVKRQHSHRQYAQSCTYEFRIQVTMTDKCIIDEAKRVSGLGVITGPYTRNNPKWRDSWRWNVTDQKAALLVRAIYPYLILKKKQAAIGAAIEKLNASFRPEGHRGHKGFKRRPQELVDAQETLYQKWRMAQDRQDVDGIPEPESGVNCHEHMMVNEALGFRVETLDEAIKLVGAILA